MHDDLSTHDSSVTSLLSSRNDDSVTFGKVRIEHIRNGAVISDETVNNLITTAGKSWIAARQKDSGQPAQLSHMACGSGSTAAAVGDTTLGSELARVALTTAGGTVSTNVVTYTATFPAGTGTGAVTEIGLLNAASVGTLVSRAVFSVKNKEAGDTIAFTWTHTNT